MQRRNLLTGVGMTKSLAQLPAAAGPRRGASAGRKATKASDARPSAKTGLEGKMLVNRPRAYAVLEELKLDGLIALNPINVYYLANTWPLMTKFRSDYPAFGTIARDPGQPIFLVTGGAETFDFANGERELPEMIDVVRSRQLAGLYRRLAGKNEGRAEGGSHPAWLAEPAGARK